MDVHTRVALQMVSALHLLLFTSPPQILSPRAVWKASHDSAMKAQHKESCIYTAAPRYLALIVAVRAVPVERT